jgi:hypothetical protein
LFFYLGNHKTGRLSGIGLGPLLYITYINDLPTGMNHICDVTFFTDYTSVLVTDDKYDNFKQKAKPVVSYLIKWFQAKSLVLNIDKTVIVKFTPMNSLHAPLVIKYANKFIEETIRTKLLGMYIDNQVNWNKHIDKFLPKLRTASFAVKMLFHIISIDVLRMVYFAHFRSV